MSHNFSASAPTVLAGAPARPRSGFSRLLEGFGRRTNMLAGVAAIAQFYTAGLAVFGAASFVSHARVGWLAQLASLLTVVMLAAARVPFRVTRLALLLFALTLLQPVLAFAVRASAPALSALHPVNGIAIIVVCALLERRLRSRA